MQDLVLVLVPPPQVVEHSDQSLNTLHPPSTGIGCILFTLEKPRLTQNIQRSAENGICMVSPKSEPYKSQLLSFPEMIMTLIIQRLNDRFIGIIMINLQ